MNGQTWTTTLVMLLVFQASSAIAQQDYFEFAPEMIDGNFIQAADYEMPTVKFTFDGYLFSRVAGPSDVPILLQDEAPAPASLTSGDLNFSGQLGGRAELVFYAKPHRFSPRASIIWTGSETLEEQRFGSPADISFFNASAADPDDSYTARYRSRFTFGDIGLRRGVSPTYGFSASVAFAEINESMDLIAPPEASGGGGAPAGAGGATPPESGFFSQAENQLYGFQLGADAQLWSNGYSKIEANLTGGIFYNDISIGAQALNAEQQWDTSATSFVGTANISLVIPADPINFRIGYQGALLTGIALPTSQSGERSIISGAGGDPTDEVWYHGLLFGIEWIR